MRPCVWKRPATSAKACYKPSLNLRRLDASTPLRVLTSILDPSRPPCLARRCDSNPTSSPWRVELVSLVDVQEGQRVTLRFYLDTTIPCTIGMRKLEIMTASMQGDLQWLIYQQLHVCSMHPWHHCRTPATHAVALGSVPALTWLQS